MKTIRITVALASIVGSWFAGRFTAYLVWMFIYSIGARVVSDEIHYQLHDSVVFWGGVAGVFFSTVVSVQLRQGLPMILSQASGFALATTAGFIGGSFDWKLGLWGYFAAYFLVVLGVQFLAPALTFLKRLYGPQIAA